MKTINDRKLFQAIGFEGVIHEIRQHICLESNEENEG